MTRDFQLTDEFLDRMTKHSLVYVATPYSKYDAGLDAAYEEACAVTGELLRFDVKAFSPIAHSHGISKYANIDPLDHQFWMRADKTYIEKADALIVVQLDGWDESIGVAMEIRDFREAGKPIEYIRAFRSKHKLTQGRIVQNLISSFIILTFSFLLYIVLCGGR
jgi:hypothetical protein